MIANAAFKTIGKKRFAAAEYASSYLPNTLPNIPSALLIALPYIAALVVISALPRERTGAEG